MRAIDQSMMLCTHCHNLCTALPNEQREQMCPVCDSAITSRKPRSLSRTWAYLLAAIILYIPSNLYPIMTVIINGKGKPSTIMDGVVDLMSANMWPLALLVFFASIVIPVVKIGSLLFLLLSIHYKSNWHPSLRTHLFHLTEFIGRWSMVDIFVVAILVAVVQFGATAYIYPDVGAVAFALVVIMTMLAANAFDPRKIWDEINDNE